jgi:hypothetical protein
MQNNNSEKNPREMAPKLIVMGTIPHYSKIYYPQRRSPKCMWLESGLLVSASLLVSGRLWLSSVNSSGRLPSAIRSQCQSAVIIITIAVTIGLLAALFSRPLRRLTLFRLVTVHSVVQYLLELHNALMI